MIYQLINNNKNSPESVLILENREIHLQEIVPSLYTFDQYSPQPEIIRQGSVTTARWRTPLRFLAGETVSWSQTSRKVSHRLH